MFLRLSRRGEVSVVNSSSANVVPVDNRISELIGKHMLASNRTSRKRDQALREWSERGFAPPAPSFAKLATLQRHAPRGATWIESGTFRGRTAQFLASSAEISAAKVITIEPSQKYFEIASRRLSGWESVEVVHGQSVDVLPGVLSSLTGDICFWLDGHYSAGDTFKGECDTPVLAELEIILKHCSRNRRMAVFVDDVRLFAERCAMTSEVGRAGYPPLQSLTDFATKSGQFWTIENDILIVLGITA